MLGLYRQKINLLKSSKFQQKTNLYTHLSNTEAGLSIGNISITIENNSKLILKSIRCVKVGFQIGIKQILILSTLVISQDLLMFTCLIN